MKKGYSLKELAALTESQLVGDPSHVIIGVETLEAAGLNEASFLANPRYRDSMLKSKAGVICIDPETPLPEGKNFLISKNPSRAFQIIAEEVLSLPISGFNGIHPSAVIHPSVKLGADVDIGPNVSIDQGCEIGDRTRISACSSIGPGVKIGSDSILHPNTTVRENCEIGNRVILQPGSVIGSCGFGFTTDAKGQHHKLEQLGKVVIEDDVEIGANTTIDRARFKETRICRGTKIDNLVQIGHNVALGENNIIVAQTGIAGSSKTGRNVVMGGQAGVVGHVEICDYAMIATRGGISKSIDKPGKYGGSPVMDLTDYNRQQVHLRKIEDYVKKIEELQRRLEKLENHQSKSPI